MLKGGNMTLVRVPDLDSVISLLASRKQWVISCYEDEKVLDLTSDLINEMDDLGIKYEVYEPLE